jgi:hypothetical protein
MIRILSDRVRVLPIADNESREIGYLRKGETVQVGDWVEIGKMNYASVWIGGFGRFDQDVGWLRWVPEKLEVFFKEV